LDFTNRCDGAIIIRRQQNGGIKMNNNVVKNVNGQVGEGVGFERIRRITGYLVGTLDRFNNGKRAEVEDRVKHGLN
jgi:anaerobic ribonucleoside-triphosphate reductase